MPTPATSAPAVSGATASTLLFVRQRGGAVVAFGVDAATGALHGPGRPVASGVTVALFTDPRGRFVYTLDETSVSALRIVDPITGALAPSGSPTPLTLPAGRAVVAIEPSGRFAYVTESRRTQYDCLGPGLVHTYAIDTLGTWSVVPGGDAVTETAPSGIAFARGGRTAYVTASGDHTQLYGPCPRGGISAYTVDDATGRLSAVAGSPFAADYGNDGIGAASPRGLAFILKSEYYAGLAIRSYRVDETTGALAPAGVTPILTANLTPGRLLVDPHNRFVYASWEPDSGPIQTAAFAIQPSGALAPVPGSPFDVEAFPTTLDPDGRFLYFIGGPDGHQIDASAVDGLTGGLSPVPGYPVSLAGDRIAGLAFVRTAP